MNDDQPLIVSPRCDRERCGPWRPCVPCRRERALALALICELGEDQRNAEILDAIANDDIDEVRDAGFEVMAWSPSFDDNEPIILDEESFDAFSREVANPQPPNEKLRELAALELALCANHGLADCPQCGCYYVIAKDCK